MFKSFLLLQLFVLGDSKLTLQNFDYECNAELFNATLTAKNIDTGLSFNITVDVQKELKEMTIRLRVLMPNPVNPKSKIELLNYNSKFSELEEMCKKNSMMRYFVGTFQKAANFPLTCCYSPMQTLLVKNWTVTSTFMPKFLQKNSKADVVIKLLAKEGQSKNLVQVFKMKVSIESKL